MAGWGSLSNDQRVRVLLELIGGPQFRTGVAAAGGSLTGFAAAQKRAAAETDVANKRTFTQQQLMYTTRRLVFYSTLGFIASTAAVARWGFQYQNSMQQARVSLQPVIKPTAALNAELNKLFGLAALSPLQFKDVTIGFTTMYKAFRSLGLGIGFTNQTLKALIDGLSAIPGKATASNLNRVSTALQHMAFLGRPAGQTLLQNRDWKSELRQFQNLSDRAMQHDH